MTALLLTLVGQLGAVAQTKIAVITDTHVLAPELLINKGTAWEDEVNNDRRFSTIWWISSRLTSPTCC